MAPKAPKVTKTAKKAEKAKKTKVAKALTSFPKLPFEIRMMIFYEAIGYDFTTPRTIAVRLRMDAKYIRPWAARRPNGSRPPPHNAHIQTEFEIVPSEM